MEQTKLSTDCLEAENLFAENKQRRDCVVVFELENYNFFSGFAISRKLICPS
jgi:hypothetical protein